MSYIIELVALVVLSYCRHLTVMFLLPATKLWQAIPYMFRVFHNK